MVTNSVEQMFFRFIIARRASSSRSGQGVSGSGFVFFTNTDFSCFFGRPSWRNASAMSITTAPPHSTTHLPVSVNVPITVASTSRRSIRAMKASRFSGGTASVIRSCDSEIQTSHGAMPWYFSGTLSSCTWQPLHSFAISATEQERPPAPLSVMLRYRPRSRASFTITSENFFWVIGSPICTAVTGLFGSSASEEKVAPWIPSLPTRPPTITMRSPARAAFSKSFRPPCSRGITPTVPAKTSGFPAYRGSK